MNQFATVARATALAGLVAASPLSAETDKEKYPGQPTATMALPKGWHRGGQVDLEISGKGLFAPKDVLFYRDGIEVVAVEELADRPMIERERYNHRRKLLDKLRKETKDSKAEIEEPIDYPRVPVGSGTRVRAKLKIKADAEPGEYPFRLVARGGIASLMTFSVGKFPTENETEPSDKIGENDSLEDAQLVPVGRTVNGFIARYDEDYFKVPAKKGQRVTFEVEAARLASYDRGGLLDLELTIYDAAGKEIARADDSSLFIEDPYLSITAAADCELFVHLSESVPSGSSLLLPYRLHISSGMRPAMLYPAGGRPGEKLQVQVIEPGRKPVAKALTVPAGGGSRTVGVFVDKATPSANPFRVFSGPNTLEREPNDTPEKATPAGASGELALNGIISKPGDVDVFKFRGKKGERYRVQLFSSALGAPLDAKMWIAPAGKPDKRKRAEDCGENELERVMVQSHRDQLDPAMVFQADADGEYLLGVEDSRAGGSPECVYRVEISKARDSVVTYLGALRDNEHRLRNRVHVAAGNRYSSVIALRDGFGSEADGEFELVAEGLPKGVTLKSPTFTSASSRLPVVFEATAGAKPKASLVRLYARPKGGSAKTLPGGFRNTVGFNSAGGNAYLRYVYLDQLAVAVIEDVPFKLQVERPKAAVTQDGELGLKVKLIRKPGFEEPVEVSSDWLPPNCGRPAPVIFDGGDTEAEYIVAARRSTPPEQYRMVITAQSRTGDRRTGDGLYFASSDYVPVTVAEPYLTARIGRSAVEVGKTGELVATLTHIKEFKGKASARLGRLPAGVEMIGGNLPIKPGQTELVFKLRATESALTGTFKGVYCDLQFEENGETVSQRSGYGTIRVDTPRGKKVAIK